MLNTDKTAEEWKADYEGACKTVAMMHAAAVGEVTGPTRGVVEDVADLRAALLAMRDAGEMLWVVLANVSGGDWTLQTPEWQEAAARWRDAYFAAVRLAPKAVQRG